MTHAAETTIDRSFKVLGRDELLAINERSRDAGFESTIPDSALASWDDDFPIAMACFGTVYGSEFVSVVGLFRMDDASVPATAILDMSTVDWNGIDEIEEPAIVETVERLAHSTS